MSSAGFPSPDDLDFGATIRGFVAGQKLLKRYTLKRMLGRGGMGVVWLAFDEALEREIAFKFLPEMVGHDRAALDDLKRETRRSLELTHPNIVRIYDFVADENCAGISMEFVDGDTLSNLRLDKPNRIFEATDLQNWMRQFCSALEYAHEEAQTAHRDLKPANLMVNKRGQLKVADFGISRSVSETITRVTRAEGASGTLVYMSPQQALGEHPSVLDDIYSVGATIFELLTSKPPFYTGEILAQVREKVPSTMAQRRKELGISGEPIPKKWEDAVAACLAKDSADRPQGAREVAELLAAPDSKPKRSRSRTQIPKPVAKPAAEEPKQEAEPPKPEEPKPAEDQETAVEAKPAADEVPKPKTEDKRPKTKGQPAQKSEAKQKTEAPKSEAGSPLPDWLATQVGAPSPAGAPPAKPGQPAPKPKPPSPAAPMPPALPEPEHRRRGWLIGALVVVLLVAGFGVWSMRDRLWPGTEGMVVETTPPGAQLFLGNKFIAKTPVAKKSLPPATYRLKIVLEGYETLEQEVEVMPNQFTNIVTQLQRSIGTLEVTSMPEGHEYAVREGEVTVKRGKTPDTLTLPTGLYTVEVWRQGWPTNSDKIKLARNATQSVKADFRPATAIFTSEPSGAEILRGGIRIGRTPFTNELTPDKYIFTAQYPGLSPQTWPLTAERGSNYPHHFTLEFGGVLVLSEPANATVRVRGTVMELGRTPFTNQFVKPGSLEYELVRPGFKPKTLRLAVTRGSTATELVRLEEDTVPKGGLLVRTEPPNAIVTLNGKEEGQGGTLIPNLLPNRYKVGVAIDGYDPVAEQEVEIRANETNNSLRFTLVRSTGKVELTTVPLGMEFELTHRTLGLIQRGRTPQSFTVPTETYAVAFRRPEWPGWTNENVAVQRGLTQTVSWEFESGTVIVSSDPKEAEIWWNDRAKGTASDKLELELPVGEIELEARLPRSGLPNKRKTISVRKGTNAPVMFDFDYGRVTTSSDPKDAEIWLGDRRIGTAGDTLDLQIGVTELVAKLPRSGFDDKRKTVTVRKGASNPLNFDFDYGHVPTSSDPKGAEVWLNNRQLGMAGDTFDLPVGPIELEARLPGSGLANKKKPFTVKKGPNLTVSLDLDYGGIEIISQPPGATIKDLVQNRIVSKTPYTNSLMNPGPVSYGLELGGYKSAEVKGSVEARKGRPLQLAATLAESTGTLLVKTMPRGALLVVDSTSYGDPAESPITLRSGDHKLFLRLPNYETDEQTIQIREDKQTVVGPVALVRSVGALDVASRPMGADYVLRHKELNPPRTGKTPAKETGLPTGEYDITISKGTNWVVSAKKLVQRNETASVEAVLPFGRVTIKSDPPGAEVFQNGRPVNAQPNVTPLTLPEVALGPVAYELRLAGYRRATVTGSVPIQSELPLEKTLAKAVGPQPGQKWTNSLGMRFVPIAPDAGVFVCIWETRLKDFDAFVRTTGHAAGPGWRSPGFFQTNGYPVVNVSWADAKAFCDWLNTKERRSDAGPFRIEEHTYRLPRDQEWSLLVGLTYEPGATPEQRANNVRGIYPWGREWPPPTWAGNYHDTISYDRFEYTAPVGSFRPSPLGIYDLGGNIWEWCEDWYNAKQKTRTARGGSYQYPFADEMNASARREWLPTERRTDAGFRVVLELPKQP